MIDVGPTALTRSQHDPECLTAWSDHLSSQQKNSSACDCFAMADQRKIHNLNI